MATSAGEFGRREPRPLNSREDFRGPGCGAGDDLRERHAHHQELRKDGRQVEDLFRVAGEIEIARDGVGRETLCERGLGDVPGPVRGTAVAEVEENATTAGGADFRQDAALGVEDSLRRRVQVSHDVAGAQQREDLRQGRRGVADVDHHRDVQWRGNLLSAAEDFEIVVGGNAARQAGFDADDPGAIFLNRGAGFVDIGGFDAVQKFAAAVGIVAEAADVQKDAHAVRRSFGDGDQLIYVVGAAGAGVDDGGDSGLENRRRGQRGIPGVKMDIDEAGHDDLAGGVNRFGGVEIAAKRGDFPVANRDIGDPVEPL